MTNKPDWKIICTGIIGLVILELYALNQGINGVLFTTIISIIAIAIGVTIPNPFNKSN